MAKIEPKIFDELKTALVSFGDKYFVGEELNRSKLADDLRNYDEALLSKLFEVDFIMQHFVKEVAGQKLFQIEQLEEAILYNDYWDTSYTKYENRIGLASNGKFLEDSQDVVLDFPFKDGVLTASMTKEDNEDGYDDAFLNEVIEKDEIDRLFDKKIFVNSKRFDENGESTVTEFNEDTDNLIIKGNNLLALHSISQNYLNKVKLIYLDVPYNTGKDSFGYNDKFNHSAWLTFIKNRIEIAYQLLSDDGSLFVHLDNHEVKYLGVILDEIFGSDNFVELITVVNNPRGRDYGGIANMHEFIYVYRKSASTEFNPIVDKDKKFPFKDSIGPFEVRELRNRNTAFNSGNRPNLFYPIFADPSSKDENGFYEVSEVQSDQYSIEILPKVSQGIQTVWRWGKPKLAENKGKNVVARPMSDGGWSIQEKYRKNTVMARSVWWDKEVNSERGTLHLKELMGAKVFAFPKPEGTLKRIIEIATNEGDLVLDFFMGSATTQAVAMKMNRRFIGIEQMDYISTVSVPRLQKVIEGEQGGISKDVNWQGGGSFVYTELMPKNMGYLQDIIHAKTLDDLKVVYNRMLEGTDTMEPADISFRADLSKIDWLQGFDENKRLLVKLLDKNGLYYNYSEIDDKNVRDLISDEDYTFNKNFYEGGD
ncbi:Type III restriction-modification system methylation subunit [Streptococcus thermophilus]|uniref:DNA methyltransferase n=1 Tax=Streptococcus thermophilus TaxID=1308 RepID=UPI000C700F64|nr:DNA methyltransferase [Streptococcus thermophilus]MBW7825766.1 site-specific DNA-methyltransferase [Streptococcus thermophilus]MCE2277235.1 site-specific DNA-methyltransferase [Streptococcus thermophilus]MCE2283701.1 site-specific DNA-methyltransferase [Streptococcus thermophilus]MCZ0707462.1 DNA methyltransferase [Streptococcus thermophilus]MDA5405487.1 DNA methyltransferase [Streptococcus thermophilus]